MKWTISQKGLILVRIFPFCSSWFFSCRMQEENARAHLAATGSHYPGTLLADLLASESELRGYLLTGDAHFARGFHHGGHAPFPGTCRV